jgi:hypothetical protein
LTVIGAWLPRGHLKIQYLEAFCRPGSTDRDWRQTVIPHRTELLSRSTDGQMLKLRSTLADGVVVSHTLTADRDEVTFQLVATNPTSRVSEAHWAQPCIRVNTFTGRGQKEYVPQCFVFLDGRLTRLPTQPWAKQARYVGPDGTLTWIGDEWTRGNYPRSFNFDPTGYILACCNQRDDNLTVFRVDRRTGRLTFTGHYVAVGNPSSVVFLWPRRVKAKRKLRCRAWPDGGGYRWYIDPLAKRRGIATKRMRVKRGLLCPEIVTSYPHCPWHLAWVPESRREQQRPRAR